MKALDVLYLGAVGALLLWLADRTGLLAYPVPALGVVFAAVVIIYICGGLPSEWRNPMRDGYPTAWYRSRQEPPWLFPRPVSSLGSRSDRADFRLLERRLVKVSDLPLRPQLDWSPPVLMRDPITGQHWRREMQEVGFNQFDVLVPVAASDADAAASTAGGAPDSG